MDTYANLKTSIANWSDTDNLTSYLDDFIDIAEAEANVRLKIRAMETRATATLSTTDPFIALPAGYLSMRHLKLKTSPTWDVAYTTPESLTERGSSVAGKPRYFSPGSQIYFDRISDSAYTAEMLYYKRLDSLSDSTTTNWLTSNAPQVLLWGSLWALYDFIGDDKNAAKFEAKFEKAIDKLNKADKKGRHGPAMAAMTERRVV